MNKTLFGTLTFAALMSVLLVKLFSQLAFADERISLVSDRGQVPPVSAGVSPAGSSQY